MTSRRGALPDNLGAFAPWLDSFDLDLISRGRSDRTREMYLDAVRWFAAWLTREHKAKTWDKVGRDQLRAFFAHMTELGYQQSYRNNVARCLQAYFKWWSAEEDLPNPYATFTPPAAPRFGVHPDKLLDTGDLGRLLKDAETGRDFESRRDAAMLRLFASTGCRLAEIAGLDVSRVDVKARTAVVTGKGDKTRMVRFDAKTALAVDRYLRVRATHPAADLPALFIGVRRRVRMTASGMRRALVRRAQRLGIKLHPHMLRHTFAHLWLDAGGAEGDLMELMGWESPQMLRHYGASARGARARRAYDRVNVMGDL